MRFVESCSVEDGTVIPAGATFTKTWRVRNDSNASWPKRVELLFIGGEEAMLNEGPKAKPLLKGGVSPGEEALISVDLVAPRQPGRYQAYFKVRDAEEAAEGGRRRFGQRLWCEIFVVAEGSKEHQLSRACFGTSSDSDSDSSSSASSDSDGGNGRGHGHHGHGGGCRGGGGWRKKHVKDCCGGKKKKKNLKKKAKKFAKRQHKLEKKRYRLERKVGFVKNKLARLESKLATVNDRLHRFSQQAMEQQHEPLSSASGAAAASAPSVPMAIGVKDEGRVALVVADDVEELTSEAQKLQLEAAEEDEE